MRSRVCAWLSVLVVCGNFVYSLAPAGAAGPPALIQQSLRGAQQGLSGAALDLNGDGLEDLVVGAPYATHRGGDGALLVYLTSPRGLPERPTAVVEGEGNLGWSVVGLGDVTGDGRSDFAAASLNGTGPDVSLSGTVAVYSGGAGPRKLSLLQGENALDRFGYSLAAADLNGDGASDLIVGAPFHSPSAGLYQKGAVYVFFGPDYRQAGAVRIPATPGNGGIGFVVAGGDINGDGLADLLMQASGKVIGYYGRAGSFTPGATPDVTFACADAGFGRAIAVIPDLDGDGLNEVAVGADQATIDDAWDSGRLYVLRGGRGRRTVDASVPGTDRLAAVDGEASAGRFGTAILPLGDLDGDGTSDLAVSALHGDGAPWPMTGRIFLFSGRALASGATVASARAIAGDARDMHLGAFLALVGKGARLAAGAPTAEAGTGAVRIFDLR